MKPNILVTLLVVAGTTLAGGCASADSPNDRYDNGRSRYNDGGSRYSGTRSNDGYYGVVASIESTRAASNNNAVAGTIIGGVVGGILGHQIGGGTGNTVATVAGSVGGAVVGHEIGKGNPERDAYRLRIRFDTGNYQTVTQASIGDLRVGDGVRIENGRAYRY
jgi:outer membrane lipoprotein SlyB